MNKPLLRAPFLVINPKAYLSSDDLLDLAVHADREAREHDIDVIFTAPMVDLHLLAENTDFIIPAAQTAYGHEFGPGMGKCPMESLWDAGVRAVFLNHAENPCTIERLVGANKRANEHGMLTVFLADSVESAEFMSHLKPDVMVCEQTSHIGTGQVGEVDYLISSRDAVKRVSPETYVLQAAGVSTLEDVKYVFKHGAEATGATSGIVCAEDPYQTVTEWIEYLASIRGKFQ